MIKNEKQYKITKKKLLAIYDEIKQIHGTSEHLPAKERLILVSLMTMQDQLETEIATYDLLKTKGSALLEERSIDDLPNLLIEFKIHSGMTQKEFSEKVGIKEQQLQRYEAENFKSISFKNLLKILHAVGLKITVKGAITGDNQSIA
ncbi:MAG TPA: helix-turn-helix transcriptional regulator [Puia sp.]|jgi:HTH-type transcriptional regulator/antitoxin HigA|nr:helix-turn-helix transcriptional regulator [Puia sp.]